MDGRQGSNKFDRPIPAGTKCADDFWKVSFPNLILVSTYIWGNRAGSFSKLLLDESGRTRGVEALDGTRHLADRVIIAAGASTPTLIDLESQPVIRQSHVVKKAFICRRPKTQMRAIMTFCGFSEDMR